MCDTYYNHTCIIFVDNNIELNNETKVSNRINKNILSFKILRNKSRNYEKLIPIDSMEGRRSRWRLPTQWIEEVIEIKQLHFTLL